MAGRVPTEKAVEGGSGGFNAQCRGARISVLAMAVPSAAGRVQGRRKTFRRPPGHIARGSAAGVRAILLAARPTKKVSVTGGTYGTTPHVSQVVHDHGLARISEEWFYSAGVARKRARLVRRMFAQKAVFASARPHVAMPFLPRGTLLRPRR